jgi:hypothetical protein
MPQPVVVENDDGCCDWCLVCGLIFLLVAVTAGVFGFLYWKKLPPFKKTESSGTTGGNQNGSGGKQNGQTGGKPNTGTGGKLNGGKPNTGTDGKQNADTKPSTTNNVTGSQPKYKTGDFIKTGKDGVGKIKILKRIPNQTNPYHYEVEYPGNSQAQTHTEKELEQLEKSGKDEEHDENQAKFGHEFKVGDIVKSKSGKLIWANKKMDYKPDEARIATLLPGKTYRLYGTGQVQKNVPLFKFAPASYYPWCSDHIETDQEDKPVDGFNESELVLAEPKSADTTQ